MTAEILNPVQVAEAAKGDDEALGLTRRGNTIVLVNQETDDTISVSLAAWDKFSRAVRGGQFDSFSEAAPTDESKKPGLDVDKFIR